MCVCVCVSSIASRLLYRIEAAATINFRYCTVRLLIEGGYYSRVAIVLISSVAVSCLLDSNTIGSTMADWCEFTFPSAIHGFHMYGD